jgi:hypothetical protein
MVRKRKLKKWTLKIQGKSKTKNKYRIIIGNKWFNRKNNGKKIRKNENKKELSGNRKNNKRIMMIFGNWMHNPIFPSSMNKRYFQINISNGNNNIRNNNNIQSKTKNH